MWSKALGLGGIVVLAAAPPLASAQTMEAAQFHALCKTSDEASQFGCILYFIGYTHGFANTHNGYNDVFARQRQPVADRPRVAPCFTGTISAASLAKVFTKYLDDHPQAMTLPLSAAADQAFARAWPCQP
jgi:hypothetical protein